MKLVTVKFLVILFVTCPVKERTCREEWSSNLTFPRYAGEFFLAWKETLDVELLYAEMQEEGIIPNAMILTELMGAYIRNDNLARAYGIFEQIKRDHKPAYIMYEILCRGLKKAGDFEKLKIVMEDCSKAFPDSPPPFSRMVMERGL